MRLATGASQQECLWRRGVCEQLSVYQCISRCCLTTHTQLNWKYFEERVYPFLTEGFPPSSPLRHARWRSFHPSIRPSVAQVQLQLQSKIAQIFAPSDLVLISSSPGEPAWPDLDRFFLYRGRKFRCRPFLFARWSDEQQASKQQQQQQRRQFSQGGGGFRCEMCKFIVARTERNRQRRPKTKRVMKSLVGGDD